MTIVTHDDLREEFDRIRRRGHAVEEEEFNLGVCCVAAPIIVAGRVLGTFTVSCPKERFDRTKTELLALLKSAAADAADAALSG
ncbi:IclR family transcriptional regulator C-terminal domain-containing protein [Aeromicrobium sp. UC242_57]|uniref:IclR family transcriptional regulator domain-containing protein n=1 Tax=Aeromicrobium sp. UC242_57 TaxID=3374624 RepID=UPI003795C0B9